MAKGRKKMKKPQSKAAIQDPRKPPEEQHQQQSMHAENVQEIPLEDLHPFKNHPFEIRDDHDMRKFAESIKEHGVLTPGIARPLKSGGYELISGHRRRYASALAGKETMPVIVRDMNNDEATILMVDSNLQREEILPSERGKAYKMKMAALRHQDERTDQLTSCQLGTKSRSDVQLAEGTKESARNVQRFIRLTNLIPDLQTRVDEKRIAFNPAEEISYLKPEEQKHFIEAMDDAQTTPSLSQAQRIKKLSRQGKLTDAELKKIMTESKKNPLDRIVFERKDFKPYFPDKTSNAEIQEHILTMLRKEKIAKDFGYVHPQTTHPTNYTAFARFFPKTWSDEQMKEVIIELLKKWKKERDKSIYGPGSLK